MFESLRIRHFSSHKDTELDLHPGVCIIIGRPQSGKTNIVRATELLAKNRPRGFRFHSDFAGKEPVVIELKLSGVKKIRYEKEQLEKNKFRIKYSIGKKEFEGVGSDVPDLIRDSLNLSELNFQGQLDKHFLITSSPGEVGRAINRVTKLEKVDSWVSGITTTVNSINKEVSRKGVGVNKEDGILIKQLKEFLEELKQYDNLPELEELVVEAETLSQEIISLKDEDAELEVIQEKLEKVNKEIAQYENWIGYVKELITEAVSCNDGLVRLQMEVDLLDRYKVIVDDIVYYEKFLVMRPLIEEGDSLVSEIEKLEEESDALENVFDTYNKLKEEMSFAEDAIGIAYDRYKEKLTELKVCPFCLESLTSKKVKLILGNI